MDKKSKFKYSLNKPFYKHGSVNVLNDAFEKFINYEVDVNKSIKSNFQKFLKEYLENLNDLELFKKGSSIFDEIDFLRISKEISQNASKNEFYKKSIEIFLEDCMKINALNFLLNYFDAKSPLTINNFIAIKSANITEDTILKDIALI
ncbi:hypothetical protein [Mycoplasma buteonis]|uniref:hypothetical protein n=1 Tax=Mycoplasma buteonis TaxID=171280 RepID=UPI00055E6012|nr:hypothetical protein [Mycoplasma buteonis]